MPKPKYSYIWSFEEQGNEGQEAPTLIGANGTGKNSLFGMGSQIGGAIDPDIPDYTYINVSRDYSWTLNNERDEVPRIVLKEMIQESSALLQRSQYYLSQLGDAITALGIGFTDPLAAYFSLYVTDDTGFYYDLPSLDGSYLNTGSNTFSTGEAGAQAGALGGIADVASTLAGGADSKLGKAVNTAKTAIKGASAIGDVVGQASAAILGDGAGYYTEQPQFYQHGGNARSYSVQFPLYNTGDYDDMIRNFQLAFMLVYQNLPNRNSKQLIMPPCLYEVSVPGVSYSPYAYMKSVDVDFVGARREITIKLPFDEPDNLKPVRVTVPEMYNIKLNLQELVGHTRNFMYHNVNRKVTTGIASVDTASPSGLPIEE